VVPPGFWEAECARLKVALRQIEAWDGDCLDHPDHIGAPNPKEIASDALHLTTEPATRRNP
jgi:hypothetical protein